MATLLPAGLRNSLLWSEELGMGWHPRKPMCYEGDYWREYTLRDATPMGRALTEARFELLSRHYRPSLPSDVVDIGIGAGAFVMRANCHGYDVNPVARAWLAERGAWRDPADLQVYTGALCFWDSLEHIPVPELAVRNAREWVFVSMPIYRDARDCLQSPHFKPGEHIWYWTRAGLVDWFKREGFELREVNDMETKLGRRGILSFAFQRVRATA